MKKAFLYLTISFTTLFGSDLLQLKNGKITNKKNQPVFLKGVNTGNWLMLEMWMLNYAGKGIEDQHEFIETLDFKDPEIPLIGNVNAEPLTSSEDSKNELQEIITAI